MKERDLYIPARKISAVVTPEIRRPVKGQTDTKARIIDLFLKRSMGLEASSLYFSDINSSLEFSAAMVKQFVEIYRQKPIETAEHFISELMTVISNDTLDDNDRKQFLETVLNEYVDLIIRLDRLAFPPLNMVYKGIPEYIPEGLSDMGHFSSTDPFQRSREKIRINKAEIYRDHKDFLVELLWFLQENGLIISTDAWQHTVLYKTLEYVHDQMPYDYTFSAAVAKDRSVSLMEFGKHKHKALCRHQALLTQILLQTVAMNSRLYRCDAWNITLSQGGRHVANLAQIGSSWYIGDATSPEPDPVDTYSTVPFIRKASGTVDEIPSEMYFKRTDFFNGQTVTSDIKYTTLNHMYYRIKDNNKATLG